MYRRKGREREAAAPDGAGRPRTLIGAYMLALGYADDPDRSWLFPRFRARFPYAAADQEYVGEIVFTKLARDLFRDYSSDSEMVDEFATGLIAVMGPDSGLRAADMAAAIRAALKREPAHIEVDPVDLMRIHSAFSKVAIHQLGLSRAEAARLFAEAEREAEDRGVWLVPLDGGAEPAPVTQPSSATGSGPWDVGQVADPRDGRADFGSLLLRVPGGSDVRLMASDDEIVAVEFHLPRTTLQLNVFAAAPGGAWDSVRRELAEQFERRSGTVREVAGIGVELWAQTADPAAAEERRIQHMRFMGKDGPGWFLRGVFSWRGKPAEEEFAALEGIFRDAVVVRGDADLADRARLRLTPPA